MTTTTTTRRGLEVGAEISVHDNRGRFTIKRITGEEVTCWGGPPNREAMRTFTADRIKTVHYRKPRPTRNENIDKGQAPRRNP